MAPSPVADSAGVVRSEFVYDRAEFPSCHAATIAETSRGELMIAFFGGKHESSSDCSIWTTHFRDGRWESPVLAADGMVDGVKTACWNPVLFQIPGGTFCFSIRWVPVCRNGRAGLCARQTEDIHGLNRSGFQTIYSAR